MCSDNKSKVTNRYYSSDYPCGSERGLFTGVECNNMRDDTKPWKNKNINFGVTKESEEVLIKDWVSSSGRVKEGSI